MKNAQIITLFVALLCTQQVQAQTNNEINWGWSDVYGNSYNSIANHLAVKDGFMYVAGHFKGELQIQGDTLLSSPTSGRPFVAKFDTNGVLIWARHMDWGNTVLKLQIDLNGDIRILCDHGLIVVYNAINGLPITYYDIPESVTDTYGQYSDELVLDFLLDSADMMYVLSLKNDIQSGLSYNRISVYATPNDTISNLVWTDTFQLGISFGFAGPQNLSLDNSNNIYISGLTDGVSLSLNGGNISGTFTGSPEMFLLKYDVSGNVDWLTTNPIMTTQTTHSAINGMDSSFYVTGYHFMEEVYHGDTISVDTTNHTQIVLLKYDLDGNYLWAKGFPLDSRSLKTFPNASWGALGNEVQITDAGDVYLRGGFTGSIVFANDTLVEDTSVVLLGYICDDVFIAKLDPNGNPIWGKYAGNSGGDGIETGDFWVDPETGYIHFVGYWADTNNLLKSSTPDDALKQIFIAKEGGPSAVSIEEIQHDNIRLLVYPNPSRGLFHISKAVNAENYEYQIVNMHGQLLMRGKLEKPLVTVDLSDFDNGVYFLQTPIGTTKLVRR